MKEAHRAEQAVRSLQELWRVVERLAMRETPRELLFEIPGFKALIERDVQPGLIATPPSQAKDSEPGPATAGGPLHARGRGASVPTSEGS